MALDTEACEVSLANTTEPPLYSAAGNDLGHCEKLRLNARGDTGRTNSVLKDGETASGGRWQCEVQMLVVTQHRFTLEGGKKGTLPTSYIDSLISKK